MIHSIYILEPVLDDRTPSQYIDACSSISDEEYFSWMEEHIYPKPIDGRYTIDSIPDLSGQWKPIPLLVKNIESEELDHLYWPTQAHVYSKKAIDVLKEFFVCAGEILPLPCVGREDLFYLNINRICDVLNKSQSDCRWLNNNVVSTIYNHVFSLPCNFDNHIFLIPEKLSTVYVSDIFKRRVEEHGLKGFVFKPVWSAKNKPRKKPAM